MSLPVRVPFLTVEDGDDLVVSFGLGEHAHTSLTLLRTPKFEGVLDDYERGVSVGAGNAFSVKRELLVSVKWANERVEIESTARNYILDVSAVEVGEIKKAQAVLRKMNFDGRFKVVND